MNFQELEQISSELEDISNKIQSKSKQVSALENQAKQQEEENEMQKMLAEVSGKPLPSKVSFDELDNSKKEVEELKRQLGEKEKQALKGMTELTFPINETPIEKGNGVFVAGFDGKTYEKSLKFIASRFNSSTPIEIDDVTIHSDKVVISKAQDVKESVKKLLLLKKNIQKMALVSLGQEDPEVERIVKYLNDSTYRDIWEATGSRQKIVFESLYSELGITENERKKKVQNFFTNCQKTLGENFPFENTGPGAWKRTFLGSLVWTRYQTLHPLPNETRAGSVETEKREDKKACIEEKNTESKTPTLNKYMEAKDIDKILYGNTE
jgi:hypothetical protein